MAAILDAILNFENGKGWKSVHPTDSWTTWYKLLKNAENRLLPEIARFGSSATGLQLTPGIAHDASAIAFACEVRQRTFAIKVELIVQGHPRSSTLVPIESPYTVINSNFGWYLLPFWRHWRIKLENSFFPPTLVWRPSPLLGGSRQNFWKSLIPQKLEGWGYCVVKIAWS